MSASGPTILQTIGVSAVRTLAPLVLLAAVALCFVEWQTVCAACLLAWAIALITELPVYLIWRHQILPLVLTLRLVAMLLRLAAAVVCLLILAPLHTEAFILIFCMSLSLIILADALIVCLRPQESAHV